MKYSAEQIGNIIYRERTKLKISQSELGQKIGVVGKQISNYEKGKLIPPMDVMLKLCDIFDCEMGYLLGEKDYLNKTKSKTAIINLTGLTEESINTICKITGKDNSCLAFGYESSTYKKILNSFITSSQFLGFIECLYDLEYLTSKSEHVFDDIKNQIGEDRFNEAMDLYNSRFNVECDNEKQATDLYRILSKIDSAIQEKEELCHSIKVARYDLHKTFESLIDSIYLR